MVEDRDERKVLQIICIEEEMEEITTEVTDDCTGSIGKAEGRDTIVLDYTKCRGKSISIWELYKNKYISDN